MLLMLFLSTDPVTAHLWLDGFEHRSIHERNLALKDKTNTSVRHASLKLKHTDKCLSQFFQIPCCDTEDQPNNTETLL